jgi:hypothetical protein
MYENLDIVQCLATDGRQLELARLQMTPLDSLHLFIYDSTSRHYNLSVLQWVMTLWYRVSERFFDFFSVLSSVYLLLNADS